MQQLRPWRMSMRKRGLQAVILLLVGMSLTVSAGSLVRFATSAGVMLVELFDEIKPVTVRNFIALSEASAYEGTFLHRAVPGFVIQGGGYRLEHSGTEPVPNFGSITNEFESGQIISNTYGTIAMAKTSDPHSATSQWFFNLADNHGLDNPGNSGGFTVFGRVISGWSTLEFFKDDSQYHIANLGGAFGELPVRSTNQPPTGDDLFFVQIDVLEITGMTIGPDGAVTLQWPNAVGMTNIVQAAQSPFGENWEDIGMVESLEASCRFIDTNTVSAARFYRVVVRQVE